MNKISVVAIIGESGSGKTTAARMLASEAGFGYICSYTTRPIRIDEIDGIDHFFVSAQDKPQAEEMSAYTLFGDFEYWTTWSQFKPNRLNVYVIDEDGVDFFRKVATERKIELQLLTVRVLREDKQAISADRRGRDAGRFSAPIESFDFVLRNDGDRSVLQTQILQLARQIRAKAIVQDTDVCRYCPHCGQPFASDKEPIVFGDLYDSVCPHCGMKTEYLDVNELWERFGEVAINDDDELEEPFLGYEEETDRFVVWKWFDDHHPSGVKDLLLGSSV